MKTLFIQHGEFNVELTILDEDLNIKQCLTFFSLPIEGNPAPKILELVQKKLLNDADLRKGIWRATCFTSDIVEVVE